LSVKLRLMRVGKKKQPTYRIVAADSRSPRNGRFIEIVGTYAPRSDPSEITLKNDKVLGWLSQGAQPTETVRKLLEISGLWGEFRASHPTKPKKDRTRPAGARAASRAPASKKAAKAPAGKASAVKASAAKASPAKPSPAKVSAAAKASAAKESAGKSSATKGNAVKKSAKAAPAPAPSDTEEV
jgi:small subunit ribosomal protein S16